jgi:purine-binding chemotaxis protein CheW
VTAPRFDPDEPMRLATFAVGDEVFAIDIMRIREIVRPLATAPVPKAPFGMVGVFNLRGRVLPLFDLRERFGFEAGARSDQARFLIVSLEGRLIGLLVDRVHEVLPTRRRDLRVADAVLRGEAARYFVAVLSRGDDLVLLLNLHRLLEGVEHVDMSALTLGLSVPAEDGA